MKGPRWNPQTFSVVIIQYLQCTASLPLGACTHWNLNVSEYDSPAKFIKVDSVRLHQVRTPFAGTHEEASMNAGAQ